jgi:hypothetical protein
MRAQPVPISDRSKSVVFLKALLPQPLNPGNNDGGKADHRAGLLLARQDPCDALDLFRIMPWHEYLIVWYAVGMSYNG